MRGRELWWALRGVMCVYKPADISATALIKRVSKAIVEDANAWAGEPTLKKEKLPQRLKPIVEEHPTSGALIVVGEEAVTDYSYHPLVVGAPFRIEDLDIKEIAAPMEPTTSGVCLLGVNIDENDGAYSDDILDIDFEIDGVLGRETLKHEIRSRVVFTCPFDHVSRSRMEKVLATVQAQYRRMAWDLTGLHLDSPEAFELARAGEKELWRRADGPVFTALKLLTWRAPHFRLHVSARAQPDAVARCLVHELGVSLGTTAACRRLHRLSVAGLTTRHALLPKQLTLNNVLRNMRLVKLLREGKSEEELSSEVVEVPEGEIRSADYDALQPVWGREYN